MARITPTDVTKIDDPDQFMRFAGQVISDLTNAVNGNIQFDTNILSQAVTVKFITANTDVKVPHLLGKTGVRYIVTSQTAGASIILGTTAQSTTNIYLQATSVPVTVTLELI